jgi:hypothetical protein
MLQPGFVVGAAFITEKAVTEKAGDGSAPPALFPFSIAA